MSITLYFKDGRFDIWTDCQPGHDFSGRCLGLGDTFAEAKAAALKELRSDLSELAVLTLKDLTDARTADVV